MVLMDFKKLLDNLKYILTLEVRGIIVGNTLSTKKLYKLRFHCFNDKI